VSPTTLFYGKFVLVSLATREGRVKKVLCFYFFVFAFAVVTFSTFLFIGCTSKGENIFDNQIALSVTPAEMNAYANQRCVFLVNQAALGENANQEPVTISATADGAAVTVEHAEISGSELAEVTVIPEPHTTSQLVPGETEGRDIIVTITGARTGATKSITAKAIVMLEESSGFGEEAATMRDMFIPFLASEHPEYGITADTVWQGSDVSPNWLVVTHYLYFSDEWELHVYWHVMIPPYDWVKIELRKRFTEHEPAIAFQIPSKSADPLVISAMEPEGGLWR
jgi:hypothetical protein